MNIINCKGYIVRNNLPLNWLRSSEKGRVTCRSRFQTPRQKPGSHIQSIIIIILCFRLSREAAEVMSPSAHGVAWRDVARAWPIASPGDSPVSLISALLNWKRFGDILYSEVRCCHACLHAYMPTCLYMGISTFITLAPAFILVQYNSNLSIF